ncbi:MAG: DUF1667 domain-containing protein [Clostridium sp.]|jgi:CxxC motif-containing protein|uniref:DUF1667 domain-containing protein n=1 Tax=Clostridium sp. TaxID=1506 RepID=UPI0025C03132|nr:DUF1667 domain-containing protein [Clostridium sp.]MCH3965090.1 DUF1667 domain-containing protein [Clostridium sp.]MCI1714311.1 DUF1667 domain-containing protein [Clostridium sp.]MCI1798573.1 DUF1667 domain-containing protein [Clostridium sp.]MCI1812696.1 DUF1667 domain-containing protein [Clostridium sp.]MCI1869382.1 DUF1667 domain-containing protein [Clostridium sp.]
MIREYTCIICPNGCEIEADVEGKELVSIEGASCKRGEEYVHQEILDPRRNIASSVLVENGVLPLVSVRLTNPVPKNDIFKVMDEIKKVTIKAPVKMNRVIIKNVLDLGSDVIATKNVEREN